MIVTIERLPASLVRLEITSDEAEFDAAVQKAARKISREVTLPGFRRGKAPVAMVQRVYGREVFVEEANRTLMDELYRAALKQEELAPVGDPEADILVTEPLAFTVTVPVYPTVTLGDYLEVRVAPVDAAIDPSRVDAIIEQVRLGQSPWVDPAQSRAAITGDQVVVNIAVTENGEEFQPATENTLFVLGESNLLDELRDTIIGLNVDQVGSVDITFAVDDDRLAPGDDRLGKQLTYTMTLVSMKERELLALDDEFAKTYGGADSLAALQQRVLDNLHSERTRDARQEVVSEIVTKMGEAAVVEIPAAMIDEAVEERINRLRQQLTSSRSSLEAYLRQAGQTETGFKADIRDVVGRDVRNSVVLREIAKAEGIAVDDTDVEAEIEEITAGIEEREETRSAYLADPYVRSVLRNDLYDRRLTDRLVEIATDGKGAVLNAWSPPAGENAMEASDPGTSDATPKPVKKVKPRKAEESVGVANTGEQDCPDGYPIKGNADSMIYHRLGDPSYDATIAEFCFATPEAAEAGGYRLPSNAG